MDELELRKVLEKRYEKIKLRTLPWYIYRAMREVQGDYGKIVVVLGACAIATAKAINRSKVGGITGFQADCVMWEFIRGFSHATGPMKLLRYENMLFPQYKDSFEKTIGKDTFTEIRKMARDNIEKSPDAHPVVMSHWKSIADGKVPFGYTIKGE